MSRRMVSSTKQAQIDTNKTNIAQINANIAQINAVTQYLRYNTTESKLQVLYPAAIEVFDFAPVPEGYGNKKLCTFTSNVVKAIGWSIDDTFPETIAEGELWFYEDFQVMFYYDGEHKWIGGSPIQGVGTVTEDGATYPGYTHVSGEWKNIAVEE